MAARDALRFDYPAELPVAQRRKEILELLRAHRCLVLTGETGSGKTTQLPKLLVESGRVRRRLAVTEPRRLAAVTVAGRLREETGAEEPVVAHAVRFDDRSSEGTLITVATDGLLLAQAAADHRLARYDAVMVDEAHERSVNIDVLLGLLRRLMQARSDLTVVVTSATIEASRFADYFAEVLGEVPVLEVAGRVHPVAVAYRPPADADLDYLRGAQACIEELHAAPEPGGVLCFLPTERDIHELRRRLRDLAGATVLPLYGRLTPAEQAAVFRPVRGRKVVLATNLAETSLTVPDIVAVVDTGLARLKRYHAGSRTERLPVEAVARDSLVQRAGRAGRVRPGRCLRLCAEEDAAARPAHTEPELRRSNLAGILLQCDLLRLGPPRDFPWLDPPAAGAWHRAEELLAELGALDPRSGRVTRAGRRLARIPTDPQIARILLEGVRSGVAHEACTVAAFLSVREPRLRPPGEEAVADAAQAVFVQEAGDVATVLAIWRAWSERPSTGERGRFCKRHYLGYRRMREWSDLRHQLWHQLGESRLHRLPPRPHDAPPLDAVHRAVLAGMLGNVLMYEEEAGDYRAAGGRRVGVHPGSALRRDARGGRRRARAPWLVACEIVETSRTFARTCAPIDPRWVVDLAGHRVKRSRGEMVYDQHAGRVVVPERVTWKGLPVIPRRTLAGVRIDPEAATECFVRQALAGDALPEDLPFVAANRRLRRRLAELPVRLRDRSLEPDADAWTAAFRRRLGRRVGAERPLADLRGLRRLLRGPEPPDLALALEDFVDPATARDFRDGYPDALTLGGRRRPLRYRYRPGEPDDGVTLVLREEDLAHVEPWRLERVVPGLLQAWCRAALASLPKHLRQRLIPLSESAAAIAAAIAGSPDRLAPSLAEAVGERCASTCPQPEADAVPPHLRLRIELRNRDGETIYAGRDLDAIAGRCAGGLGDDPLAPLRRRWETAPGPAWPAALPEAVTAGRLVAHPAVVRDRGPDAGVAVRTALFRDPTAARAWHADGVAAFLERALDAKLAELAGRPANELAGCERLLGGTPARLRRGLGLAAALADLEPERVRDAGSAAAAQTAAIAALRKADAEIGGLLVRGYRIRKAVAEQRRRGVRGLAAAAVLGRVGADLDLLCEPGWWELLPWPAIRRWPLHLEAQAGLLAPGARPRQEARRERLLATWEAVAGLPRRRLAALGLRRELRRLRVCLVECLTAAAGGPGPDLGASDLECGRCADRIEHTYAAAEAADGELVRRAAELRPYLERAAGHAAELALRDLDRFLAAFPDRDLGADPAGHRERLQSLLVRARAAAV